MLPIFGSMTTGLLLYVVPHCILLTWLFQISMSFNHMTYLEAPDSISSRKVRIVASVPGYHNGSSLTKWGHMKLRTVLAGERFRDEFVASPIVYQVLVPLDVFIGVPPWR